MVGKNLSHYKILEELGRGGMGIVYKAEDTKLDRTVAIKVLPSAALASADDRARFYREAKAAAQLHHPHIASVFEIDEAVPEGSKDDDLRPFIAMEFIEGETLEDHIKNGPLKLDEAVRIASQIASALEAAHDKDIVHRDLKSQNVMLTSKGEAKILDFGLAQTAASTKLTRMGSTLGTVAYMSPEQARGEEVDRRTDIWSLGVVLYEMIAGRSPFPGEYDKAVIYNILNQDPEPLTALRTGVPMELEHLAVKLLQKLPEHRFQHADDVGSELNRIQIQSLSATGLSAVSRSANGSHRAHASVPRTIKLRTALLSGIGFFIIAFIVLGKLFSGSSAELETAVAGTIELQDEAGSPLAMGAGDGLTIAISPDGSQIVFPALDDGVVKIFVRDLNEYRSKLVLGSDNGGSPSFSPDGTRLAFCDDRNLKIVDLRGGLPTALAEISGNNLCRGTAWLSNEELVFVPSPSSGLFRIGSDGSSPTQLTHLDRSKGELSHRWPHVIPGSRDIVFTIKNDRIIDFDEATIAVYDSDLGVVNSLFDGGTYAHVVDDDLLLYARDYELWAVPFEPRSLEIRGQHVLVADSVYVNTPAGEAVFAISENGVGVFRAQQNRFTPPLQIGTASSIYHTFENPPGLLQFPQFSPDESQAVVETAVANNQLYIVQRGQPGYDRFTSRGNNQGAAWTPDGNWISYTSDRSGEKKIYRQSVVSDSLEVLYDGPDVVISGDWSPEGNSLLFEKSTSSTGSDVWLLSKEDEWIARPLLEGEYSESFPRFSDDGSLLIYLSDESGEWELYARRFPDMSDKIQISNVDTPFNPSFDGTSRRVYYQTVRGIVRVTLDDSEDLSVSAQQIVHSPQGSRGFDVSGDGEQFLMMTDSNVFRNMFTRKLHLRTGWLSSMQEHTRQGQ